jgi:hypothetical protein
MKFWPLLVGPAFIDALTTTLGTMDAFGGPTIMSILMSLSLTGAVFAVLLLTFDIHDKDWPLYVTVGDGGRYVLIGFWCVALGYDIFTSIYGLIYLLNIRDVGVRQITVVIFGTIIICGATLLASLLAHEYRKGDA